MSDFDYLDGFADEEAEEEWVGPTQDEWQTAQETIESLQPLIEAWENAPELPEGIEYDEFGNPRVVQEQIDGQFDALAESPEGYYEQVGREVHNAQIEEWDRQHREQQEAQQEVAQAQVYTAARAEIEEALGRIGVPAEHAEHLLGRIQEDFSVARTMYLAQGKTEADLMNDLNATYAEPREIIERRPNGRLVRTEQPVSAGEAIARRYAEMAQSELVGQRALQKLNVAGPKPNVPTVKVVS